MSDPFKIIYGKGRFPIQQIRADGSKGCRGCGEAIPKGRSSWCSNDCWLKFEPAMVIRAAKERDKEVCAGCGFDYRAAYAEWLKKCYESDASPRFYSTRFKFPPPQGIEYDHIVPFSEGGFTVLENIRSLCSTCHKARTKEWHRERKAAKTQQSPELYPKHHERRTKPRAHN